LTRRVFAATFFAPEARMKTIGEILRERDARVLSCALFYVQQGLTVAQVCRHMKERNVGAVCVFDGERLVGLFSERDVVRRVIAKDLDPGKISVERVMTRDVLVAHPEEDYHECLVRMQEARVRHLPVVTGHDVLGMLSIRDLFQELERHREFQLQALTDYVYHVPPGS
jgi:CBS domain-containing protein